MLGRVLGFLSLALGLFALWAAPVSPRGADASEPSTLQEIVSRLHDIGNGDGGPFTVRSYNGFPIVAGLIFTLVGLPCLIFGS